MIFAKYNYSDYNNDNKEDHPIQPYTWDNWLRMVNEDAMYCENPSLFKKIELFYYVFIGKVTYSRLRSCHWYWKKIIKNENKQKLKRLKTLRRLCEKDYKLIAFYFNSKTSMQDIDNKISVAEKLINGKLLTK